MSVTDSATVKWALYDTSGIFTGQQGTAGRTFSGTKATAFVGTDDQFYIVVNAANLAATGPGREIPGLKIYPDPAKNFISITGIREKTVLALYNLSGEMVLRKETGTDTILQLQNLEPGVYALVLSGHTGRSARKILIKN
ncbi:MAG: T9SS type A sorting domain-containing protein [Bacteroidota bacterium]